ncbi:MAG: DUF1963 domain-containing protein [Paracoccaceae bacterium]
MLKPIVRSGPSEAGWFGGEPMLPPNVAWPEIDGVALCFLAQIDLAKLPTRIWSGLGPCEGSLVFFNHPKRCAAKVLFVKGDLAPRSADVPFPEFMGSRDHGTSESYPYFNRFPVMATEHAGRMPEPVGWIPGQSKNFPPPFGGDTEKLDWALAQHQPFDAASLDILMKCMAGAIDMRVKHCAILLDHDLEDVARHKVLSIQGDAHKTREALDAVVREARLQPFDTETLAVFFRETAQLQLHSFELVRSNGNKITDIKPVPMLLSDPERSGWGRSYLAGLDRYLFDRFVQGPDSLPAHYRDRIERICEFRAAHGSGGMSHAPRGFIHTPHGRESSNEVLLELPSSTLNGWVWGGFNALVFLIDREALKRGDFSMIKADITN